MRGRDILLRGAARPSLTAQVQALFAGGKVGGMWDMGDTATLFQDTAGATPVTAVTQPIGRVNDKSGNGNHATQPTAGSRPLFSALKNLLVKTEQLDDGGLNSGIWKRRPNVVVTPNQGSGGFSDLDRIENSVVSGMYQGLYQATAVAAANKTFMTQVTLAAVSGTTTAVLYIGAYDGGDVGNSAVVSLTTTPTTFTVSHTFGAGALGNCYLEIAPNVVGVPILAGRAQLEFGAIATRYQRVNTASDYDTVGFPAFAQFDGINDLLQVAGINLSSTDKVLIGLAFKPNTTALTVAMEYSPMANSNSGAFYVSLNEGGAGLSYFQVNNGGVVDMAVNASAMAAANTTIVEYIDLTLAAATSKITARINGAAATLNTVFDGADSPGNFGNYDFFMGARSGGFPSNMNLYRAFIRAGAATAGEQLILENWLRESCGV